MRGRRIAVVGIGVLALLAPATASGATTLTRSGATALYSADPGLVNALQIERVGANYVFTDAAAVTIVPAAPCATVAANVATCPVAGTSSIQASLNDLDDFAAVGDSVTAELSRVTFFGAAGSDTLNGARNVPNQLTGDNFGDAGNDVLTGGDQDDSLGQGDGTDIATGGPGDDRLGSGGGTDVLNGGPGSDSFDGSTLADGPDTLIGGPDSDRIDLRQRIGSLAISLDDVANDGSGCPGAGCENDNIRSDIEGISLGSGNDTFTGSAGTQDVQGDSGNDVIDGAGGGDEVAGGNGNDTLLGGDGSDFLDGGEGSDSLDAGGGDDRLRKDFFDAADVYAGGSGLDALFEGNDTREPLSIDVDGIADDGLVDNAQFDAAKDNVLGDVEGLSGSDGDDTLIGSDAANEIEGAGGNDVIVGGGGADGLDGAAGDDRIDAGAGVDALDGGSGADSLRSRDRDRDQVDCGSSIDSVLADSKDEPEASCDQTSEGLVIDPKAKASGPVLALKLTCPAAEGIDCKAKLKLSKGKRTVGSAKAKIKSGKTKTLKLKPKGLGDSASLEASASFKDAAGEKVTSRRRVRVS